MSLSPSSDLIPLDSSSMSTPSPDAMVSDAPLSATRGASTSTSLLASESDDIGRAEDFEYSVTCLGAGYVGGPTMVREQQYEDRNRHTATRHKRGFGAAV